MITPISHNNYQPTFNANLNSPKLRFSRNDFYIKIRGYGRNTSWADKIIETADEAVKFIRKSLPFEFVIKRIVLGVTKANQFPYELAKREHTGILRTKREGWKSGSEWSDFYLTTNYDSAGFERYRGYKDRFDKVHDNPLTNPYEDISLTIPVHKNGEKYLRHGEDEYVNNAFNRVADLYNSILKRFVGTDVKEKDLKEINDTVAEMRWILAHSTPWERGSDAISNVLMKSIYKALGVKTYEPAKNVSFDLEAFCTELKDYKNNFTNFFTQPPTIAK